MFKVEFKTGGAAFCNPSTVEEDDYYEGLETQRILQEICKKIEAGYREGSCMDINGNRVGSWELK